MTDKIVLQKLLEIALPLMDCEDTSLHAFSEWGNALWEIHKYLEDRLFVASETDETKHDKHIQIINKFHGVKTVNIYNQ